MFWSYLIYVGLLVVCWLCSWLASRRDSKKPVWLIILTLTLIAGLRNYSVGIDTQGYVDMFGLIAKGDFQYAYGLEESFKYICYAVLRVFPHESVLLTLLAFVTNYCIITRFWELRKISSFRCMVLCYYMGFYFMTMNGLRQFCAVAIVFYSTRYLSRKKILPFIIGVLVAMLFHQTALIGFALLAINCLRWKELPRKHRTFYICVVVLSPALGYLVLRWLERYTKYFSNPVLDIGFMILIKLLFFLFTAIFMFVLNRGYVYFPDELQLDNDDRFNMMMVSLSYLLGLCLTVLGYIFTHADRIGWYYYLFEGVYFGMLFKGKNLLDRVIFFYVIVLLVTYGFVYSMINNSQGNMPYLFFWQ